MAKQVLVKSKCLMLPYLKVEPSRDLWKLGTRITQEEFVVNRGVMFFDDVKDEVRMDGRIPDVVMWKNGRRLLVEIFVTHDICDEKLRWIQENDLATIRVDLSWAGYGISSAILTKSLREGCAVIGTRRRNIVTWVHHPHQAAAQSRVNAAYLSSIQSAKAANSTERLHEVQGRFAF